MGESPGLSGLFDVDRRQVVFPFQRFRFYTVRRMTNPVGRSE